MTAFTQRHRRLLSLAAATGIATVGLVGLSTPAHAADGNVKVWVCKYVRTPGGFELLKGGKNPIEVSANSVNNKGPVNVGDKFPDAQGFSVVVQVEGADPGVGACSTTPPPPPPGTPGTPGTPGEPGAPGTGAPGTGGDGGGMPLGLIGGGVLLTGAGLLAAEAQRRRRGTAGS
jgi:hypothetical protein